MTCYVPQNQPLYQALLEKAASYPPEKHYNAKAYTDAAHQISLMKVPVSTDGKIYTGSLPSSIPTLGSVYLFCRDTISRLYTPDTDSNNILENNSDDSDDEQENEQDKVYNAIISVCSKKGWKYSDNLITEFEQWYLTASHLYTHIYDPNTQQWVRPKAKHRVAREWAMYCSLSLQNQDRAD